MVKDILGGVLDAVEEQVRRRRSSSREQAHNRRSHVASSSMINPSVPTSSQNSNAPQKKGSSMRDILLGGKGNNTQKNANASKAAPFSYSERAKLVVNSDPKEEARRSESKKNEKSNKGSASKSMKATRTALADQNTIPTIASTNSTFTPSIMNVTSRKAGTAPSTDSSSTDSVEAQKPKNAPSDPIKHASPSPPLPTLLSPGNNNSTSSSVASSLDAPHAGHHTSRQSENDVGCHLLDVCDRLSSEISVFMKRREAALAVRRHERGLVLAALEKTLGLIWPGIPTVEMYGSCATNLDLPS